MTDVLPDRHHHMQWCAGSRLELRNLRYRSSYDARRHLHTADGEPGPVGISPLQLQARSRFAAFLTALR